MDDAFPHPGCPGSRDAGPREGGRGYSGSLRTLTSIADALDSSAGIRCTFFTFTGSMRWERAIAGKLLDSICTELKLCDVADWKSAGVEFADKGEFSSSVEPPALAYLGSPVWNSPEEWHAAAPFVVHWVIHLKGHSAALVLDEINWWPLVLSLKCRRVIAAEAHLSGPDQHLLEVCSEQSAQDPGGVGRFYPWIPADQAAKLAKIRPRGVLVNRELKAGLVDWGLSDVLMAVGPLGGILRDGLRQLMAKSAAFDPSKAESDSGGSGGIGKYDWKSKLSQDNALDQEFIGVTHSLGSYLLFNTLNPDLPMWREGSVRIGCREEDGRRERDALHL